jgi:hypothetical protein
MIPEPGKILLFFVSKSVGAVEIIIYEHCIIYTLYYLIAEKTQTTCTGRRDTC